MQRIALPYRLPTPISFWNSHRKHQDAHGRSPASGTRFTHVSPDPDCCSSAPRFAARLGDMLCMVTACYVRYGLDRMWLDCSGLAHGPGSLCSVYWQMAMIMSAVSSSYTSTSVDGRPEDYLDCYRRLDVAFEQTHVEEAEFHLRDISDQVREIRDGSRDRGGLTFFSDILSWVRELYPREEKFQWWLATKLAVERGRSISNDPKNLLRSYQSAVEAPSTPGALVMDEVFPFHAHSYIFPYMLLSVDGSLFMETSEATR